MMSCRNHSCLRRGLRGMRATRRIWVAWAVLLLLLLLDWRSSVPHRRFDEPMPLALGHGPAADAGHCSLAPTR